MIIFNKIIPKTLFAIASILSIYKYLKTGKIDALIGYYGNAILMLIY